MSTGSLTHSQKPPTAVTFELSSHSHQSFSFARFHAFLPSLSVRSLAAFSLFATTNRTQGLLKMFIFCAVLVNQKKRKWIKKKWTPTVSASRAMRAFRHGEEGGIMISATQCCHRGPSSQAKPTDGNCRRDFDEGFMNVSSPNRSANKAELKIAGFNQILPNACCKKLSFKKRWKFEGLSHAFSVTTD